jgi:hypothetical protein
VGGQVRRRQFFCSFFPFEALLVLFRRCKATLYVLVDGFFLTLPFSLVLI